MSDSSDDRPRPTPRPRPGATGRPTPRPRVAGSRREREEAEAQEASASRPAPSPRAARPATRADDSGGGSGRSSRIPIDRPVTARSTSGGRSTTTAHPGRRGRTTLALVLALLCVLTAAGGGWLLWDRFHPRYVDATVFSATKSGVQALYAFDYHDANGSVRRKLDVLTGSLHDQYKTDLSQGGIIDTYKQVSATTSYVVQDVGLQQINDAQDTATVVVFGQYVVKSVNSGKQAAPQGSECKVTADGAQSCTQTVQVGLVKVGGDWKINELTLLTTS
jgi:hypothetical protein